MNESEEKSALRKRKALRLGGYDYASAGWYFVTVCTRDRRCLFGEIVADAMNLSELAVVVETCWLETPKYFASIAIDAFVVMPNHIHGILILNDQEPGAMNRAPTLGEVIRSFKARCTRAWTRTVRDSSGASVWQRGFHEHVIRNEWNWHAAANTSPTIRCNGNSIGKTPL